MGWALPLLAFAAMFCQDVICVVMVRAETSGRAHLAAAGDLLQDACGLASLGALGDSAIAGGGLALSASALAVVAGRLAGDYFGTYTGVRLGVLIDKRRGAAS